MGKREFYWVRTSAEAKGEDGLRVAEVYVRDGHRDIYLTGRVECFDEHQVKLMGRIALPGEIDAGGEATERSALEAAVDRMGWPEINAYYAELNLGQGIDEDAGGYFLRALRRLFGLPSNRKTVERYQAAARAMIGRAA
ncbi:hypothetical protein [Methylobacterium sp. WL116]|uniref:hypothetical protein n=1 Tax=Methylobacterium sp. WL116 TaxID=2603889 RepID=UPI0011CAADCD|nr:hypothetical protein [Methylobacterium sp. WL116]TXM92631.1 hypothetical protein FV223_11130 [Methylobacterium sp. WL116]